MRIVSWNVNGLRAVLGKGFEKVVQDLDADFFCLQESKAHQDQVPLENFPHLSKLSSTWASAEKKGYSGAVTFTPHKKTELSNKMGIKEYDAEGRANLIFGKGFTLVNKLVDFS